MQKYLYAAAFLLAVFAAVFLDAGNGRMSQFDTELLIKAEKLSATLSTPAFSNQEQNGQAVFTSDGRSISERQVNDYVVFNADPTNKHKYLSASWNDGHGNFATLSATGVDRRHHFANSYLVGIRPFAVDNKWLPLYLLSKRKSYQLDSEQYGVPEIWQNSAQAYINMRGDCEDHALALADWLISEGIDAKVALGTYKGGGHAWVIAYHNNQVFLLEATDKRSGKNWNHYPIASSANGYLARVIFDREFMWYFDSNRQGTTSYALDNWQKVSRFEKISPEA